MNGLPIDTPSGRTTRQEFLANIIMGAGTVLGLGLLAGRFVEYLYPVVPPPRTVEMFLGKRDLIPTGGAHLFEVPPSHIYVLDVEGELRAFNAVCTHLGCIIKWHQDKDEFICPCHKGTYNTKGVVVSGPPPRPLDHYPVVERDGNVYVQIQLQEAAV